MATQTQTAFPTFLRARLPGGLCRGEDGTVWLVRSCPLGPVADAVSPAASLTPGRSIMNALAGLEEATRIRTARRGMSRSAYRQVHLLGMNIPTGWRPERDKDLSAFLASAYPDQVTHEKVLLLAVRLLPSMGSGGWRSAVDSMVDFLVTSSTPLEDFRADAQKVGRILTQAGLDTPTPRQFQLAETWFTLGRRSDAPMLTHADHIHVFGTQDAANTAQTQGLTEADCKRWGDFPDHHTITVASVAEFDFAWLDAASRQAQWALDAFDQGALCVSARFNVEPSAVTRAELRRNSAKFRSDIAELAAANKPRRAEMDERLGALEEMEGAYSSGHAPATAEDTRITVVFSGRTPFGDYDAEAMYGIARMHTMTGRQDTGLQETMLCSPVRANPNRHDIPVTALAYSGLPSLSEVGDEDGAVLGFTERDAQPARVSPTAAAAADALPLMSIVGATRSGKLLPLDTVIPTPDGYTTMGELEVGSRVIGRDGRPCEVVWLSPVDPVPELFEIAFSDGQTVIADRNHQWVIADFWGRNRCRSTKRKAALEAWATAHRTVDNLEALADRLPTKEVTLRELTSLVIANVPQVPWKSHLGVSEALSMVDCPIGYADLTVPVRHRVKQITKTDPVVLHPTARALTDLSSFWRSHTGGNASRWGARAVLRADAADRVAAHVSADEQSTAAELTRRISAASGAPVDPGTVRLALKACGTPRVAGHTSVTMDLPATSARTRRVRVVDQVVGVKSLALRLSQMYAVKPLDSYIEYRMTTGEMLASGLRETGDQARYAVRVASPLELPEADLLIPPYVLGAWLGDGDSGAAGFTCADPHILERIASEGHPVHRSKSDPIRYRIEGLSSGLRAYRLLRNKHIPIDYLRASRRQRLDLLQGLMDTDGYIAASGAAELTLCNERLVLDAVDLIRGLGIKTSVRRSAAFITEPDPFRPGRKRRRKTGYRWRLCFKTSEKIVSLPRKADRLPTTVGQGRDWLYIRSITPVPSRPGRCIMVDSSDHTYLVGRGYVPTSNTQTLLWLALQFSRIRDKHTGKRRPNIIFDPKFMSDHTDVVLPAGGQVASLDDMASADGVMDPIRCAINPEDGVNAAVSMLLTVNPWGVTVDETAVTKAVAYGVRAGARCTGQALLLARDAGQAPADMVQKVFDLADSTPLFRAVFGVNPSGDGLRVADGITLIKAGNTPLELPAPGKPPSNQLQRVTVAVVRMGVFCSVMALAGRGGILHLDEGWVFMIDPTEMDRLGRVAASQGVLAIIYTQRVSDVVDAGLSGYISRGIILSITDEKEARAACQLFRLEQTPERLARIMAPATSGASKAPDPRSLKALVDPNTGRVLRGAVGLYVDLHGRAVPVVIQLPEQFLHLASTTPDVVAARARERAAGIMPDLGFADGALEDPQDHLVAPVGLYMLDQSLGVIPGPVVPARAATAPPATVAAVAPKPAEDDEWASPVVDPDDQW